MLQLHRSALESVMRFLPPSRLVPSRCALAILIVVHGTILRAQPTIAPGTRVRIAVAAVGADTQGPWRVGKLLSRSPTTLMVDTGNVREPIGIAIGTIRQIDVSRGRPSRTWTGALIGGLVSGGAFVAVACAFSNGSCNVGDNVGGFLAYYAVGAVPGAIAGGAIGARRHGAERWQQVWAPPPAGSRVP